MVNKYRREFRTSFIIRLILLSLLSVIGFDFLLHAGILSPLYRDPGTFLLPSETAFKLIPLGYLAFAILNVMLAWLMIRLGIQGVTAGLKFGIVMGLFIWMALALGVASIAAAPIKLLVGWVAGQTMELGLAGAILGAGFMNRNLKRLGLWCLVIFLVCTVLGIVIQNIFNY